MIKRRDVLKYAIALPAITAFARPVLASSPEVFNTNGIAIHGYDPVGYFNQGDVTDGTDAHMLKWMGAIWRFADSDNMAAFEANPHQYAPQYGGYCAFAMAHGAIATTVPEAWTIHDRKLYLNFSVSVRDRWRQDIPGFVALANENWPAALNM